MLLVISSCDMLNGGSLQFDKKTKNKKDLRFNTRQNKTEFGTGTKQDTVELFGSMDTET
jgi:hypothetical protein